MIEILFRGKGTSGLNAGDWIYGYFVKDFWRIRKNEHGILPVEEKRGGYCEVIPETVGQYSGKDDDNGEKLFEGDIVKGLFLHGDSVLSVVTFKDGAFGLEWNRGTIKTFSAFTSICNVTYEKIGNIFDNPELLKEGETE